LCPGFVGVWFFWWVVFFGDWDSVGFHVGYEVLGVDAAVFGAWEFVAWYDAVVCCSYYGLLGAVHEFGGLAGG